MKLINRSWPALGLLIMAAAMSAPTLRSHGHAALSIDGEAPVVAIKVDPLPSQTKQLKFLDSFPKDKDEPSGIYFAQAQTLSHDHQGRIYVTDLRGCQIFVFSPDGGLLRKIGRSGQGPGEFNFPGKAALARGQLVVLDVGNMRIQFFSQDGQFVRSARLLRTYADMTAAKDGTIYAVTAGNEPGDLIDTLGAEGERLSSFGRPPESVERGLASPRSWLAMSPKDELFVAYWFAPIVQVYSLGGELKVTFEIRYEPMLKKLSHNPSRNQVAPGGGRRIGQSIIEAIDVSESSFFILHRGTQGRIDILEIKRDGTFLRDFWTRRSDDYYPMGLAVHEAGGMKTFYLLQIGPENRVDVFVAK
jgi:hypothetical protein